HWGFTGDLTDSSHCSLLRTRVAAAGVLQQSHELSPFSPRVSRMAARPNYCTHGRSHRFVGNGKAIPFRCLARGHHLPPDGIVVALRKTQTKRDSPIIGAVIVEYTQIYDDLLDAEWPDLYLSVALAIGCVLLAIVLGFRVANRVVNGLKNLQRGVERSPRATIS